ncbi:hypothetical protein DPMN_147939 [Dreissena polymorpha]|uniref:Uncharacterized protein n=1 Tax=Dreissena polymorpha TaxID=45954 RepID=A0A9D4IZR9_DREPO|nr:hypothetical protein DPMN_147939 [Dreissena polymorpha]
MLPRSYASPGSSTHSYCRHLPLRTKRGSGVPLMIQCLFLWRQQAIFANNLWRNMTSVSQGRV